MSDDDKRERRLPDWLVAIFTIVIACSAIAQCHEMQTGGIDTHNLAIAAQRQAAAMQSLATATGNLKDSALAQALAAGTEATAMDKLRLAGEAQAKASAALANAGAIQAASTRDLAANSALQVKAIQAGADIDKAHSHVMEAEQRPWLYASAISLDRQPGYDINGLSISLRYEIVNSGHLPASHVSLNIVAYPFQPFNDMRKYEGLERQVCNFPDKFWHASIFPGQSPSSMGVGTTLRYADIKSAIAQYHVPVTFITPFLATCLIYQDPIGAVHHTPYLLWVFADGGAVPIDPAELAKKGTAVKLFPVSGMSPD
jgi:hypothetical protein